MTTTHDDLPHPVPPYAFLRWKENYFFIIIDPLREACGIVHYNFEPGFNRARFSCNLTVRGKQYNYLNQTPFPDKFEYQRELGDDRIRLTIIESHQRFELRFAGEQIGFDLSFERRLPSFDFAACKYAAPEVPSFREMMTLGLNLPFEHLQQAMRITGSVTIAESGDVLAIDGYGYRDHSWCIRSDNLVREHTWSGLNFPDRAFGVMTIELLTRPGVIAKEGYVSDADGTRALRSIEVRKVGRAADGLPQTVVHELCDVFGKVFTIESDIAGRFGQVPLSAEAADGKTVYSITENFVRSRLVETGEEGQSLVELGVTSST